MKRFLTTLLLLQAVIGSALPLPVGTWRIFSSYSTIEEIEPAGKDIYVLASASLYSYNTADASITTYDRTTCLNNADITHIKWVPATRVLIITYSDTSFDIMTAGQDITYNTDIKDKSIGGEKRINHILAYGQYAYLSTTFGIVKFDTRNMYVTDSYMLGCNVSYCYIDGNSIYAATEERGILRGNFTDNLLDKNQWHYAKPYAPAEKPAYTPDAANNCYWAADAEGRLTRYKEEGGEMVPVATGVIPDGPVSNDFWRLYLHNGRLYGTSGHFSAGMVTGVEGRVHYLENETWHELEKPTFEMLGRTYQDVNCMAFDPTDKTHFWSGGRNGLVEYRNDRIVNCFNPTNTPVPPTYNASTTDALVCSMLYDRNNTLWAMFGWTDDNIVTLSPDNTIVRHPHDDVTFDNRLGMDMQGTFISPTNGLMWWVNTFVNTQAVFKYDHTADLLTTYREIKDQDGNSIETDYLYDIVEDRSGNIWLATTSGPFYFTYENNRTTDTATLNVTKHKVPRNDGTNYADYLLDGITVRCIAIDAMNRKWFGTVGNGVFLISSDNNTQLAHFTSADTPLMSDIIYDILIDDATGIVYFATDKGLCAYQSDVNANTSADGEMSKDNVWAYPNPVTPDHTGDIVIIGLAENTDVKIVTSSGRLVHSGRCAGGSYRWDGCDTDGRRVASGVYMVLVAKSDGSKGVVTKIGVVR